MSYGIAQVEELAYKRCFNHRQREAAARCPHCRRFFCRECVTEHDGRLACAACLRRLIGGPSSRGLRAMVLLRFAWGLAGLAAAWLFFYYLGRALLQLPTPFHEGTLWGSP